jgi:hypothetical protein
MFGVARRVIAMITVAFGARRGVLPPVRTRAPERLRHRPSLRSAKSDELSTLSLPWSAPVIHDCTVGHGWWRRSLGARVGAIGHPERAVLFPPADVAADATRPTGDTLPTRTLRHGHACDRARKLRRCGRRSGQRRGVYGRCIGPRAGTCFGGSVRRAGRDNGRRARPDRPARRTRAFPRARRGRPRRAIGQ